MEYSWQYWFKEWEGSVSVRRPPVPSGPQVMANLQFAQQRPGFSFVVLSEKTENHFRWKKIRAFGENKFKEILFWLNILYPVASLALHFLVRPDFLFVFSGFTPGNMWLGEGSDNVAYNKTTRVKLLGLCEITEPAVHYWFYDAVLMVRKSVCFVHAITIYLMALNLLEIFFYYKIFSFASR